MSDYTKIVDYAAKDGLSTGNPSKKIKGTELGAEFDAIVTAIATKSNTASPTFTGTVTIPTPFTLGATSVTSTGAQLNLAAIRELPIPLGDQSSAITTGTAKITFRMPYAMTLTSVRASLKTASSSGVVTFDINEGGTTVLSTKLTIDANETTSETAATAAVISDSALADNAEITIDIDTAGTGAVGPWVYLYGTRS